MPSGHSELTPLSPFLALNGANLMRLGFNRAQAGQTKQIGVPLTTFAHANIGLQLYCSPDLQKYFGHTLIATAFQISSQVLMAEAILSEWDLESGKIYCLGPDLRRRAALQVDLHPNLITGQIEQRLTRPGEKTSWSNHLRKQLRLGSVKLILLTEFRRSLPTQPDHMADLIKSPPLPYEGTWPIDKAI